MDLFIATALVYNVDIPEIKSKSRERPVTDARCQIMRRMYENGDKTVKIAKLFHFDHTTVIYNIRKYNNLMKYDADFARRSAMIDKLISNKTMPYINLDEFIIIL